MRQKNFPASHLSLPRLMILLASALFVAPSFAASPNLLQNPGFEEGPGSYPGVGKHWEPNDAQPHPEINELTSATNHSGAWSQLLKAHSQWDLGAVRQATPYNSIAGGKTYLASAWIKTANVGNPAGWYVFGIVWLDGADAYIGDAKMPRQETNNYDWRLISFTAVAPPNARRAVILLTRHTDGDAWYDDVYFGEYLPNTPEIALAPATLAISTWIGETASAQIFTVANANTGTLNYTITDNAAWLSVSPAAGSSTGPANTHTITYETTDLTPGVYPAGITVADPNAPNSPRTLSVELTIRNIPGDFDDDLDVDQEDFGAFQACFSGPGVDQTDPACARARLDGDTDVDGDDLARFRQCLTVPGAPAEPDCAGV